MIRIRRVLLAAVAASLAMGIVATPPGADGARRISRTAATLNRTLPETNFDGIALADALDFLRDITNANIVVNWRALEGAGVTRDTVINMRLRNVTLRKALTLLLSEASAGEGVTYSLDDGVIEITTSDLANQKMFTRVYPVGDLLMEIPNFTNAPNFSLDQNQASGGGSGGGGGGGGGGQGLFGGGGGGGQDREDDSEVKTRAEREEELITLIRDVIYPDVWRENGGTASIRMFRDNLVVTAPRNVHEAIGGTWD